MVDDIAAKVRTARKDAGLSREQLAGHLGVSLSTVVRLETGRTQRITLATLALVAAATNRPLSYFIDPVAA